MGVVGDLPEAEEAGSPIPMPRVLLRKEEHPPNPPPSVCVSSTPLVDPRPPSLGALLTPSAPGACQLSQVDDQD